MNDFDNNFKNGSLIENFLIDYFYECYGWTFISGTRNAIVENAEAIEKLFNCKYVAPKNKKHGPLLLFEGREEPITMPDLLFKSKNNLLFWVESKGNYNPQYQTIDIEAEKIYDYNEIYLSCKSPVWVVVTVIDGKTCDIYSAKIKDIVANIIKNKLDFFMNGKYNKLVFRLDLSSGLFRKMNSTKINFK